MAETKPVFQNKIGKITDLNKSTITIEDQYGKAHTLALEPGGKIHSMLEGVAKGDAGEWNKNKNGFCVFWATTKKVEPFAFTTPPVSTGPNPSKEILKQNLDSMQAAQKKSDEALEKINAEERKVPVTETPAISKEDRVRAICAKMMASDKVGMRISLAGAVNSIIDMKKISNDTPVEYEKHREQIKSEALDLMIWMDSLTTQNFKE